MYCINDIITFTANSYNPSFTYTWSINNNTIGVGQVITPNLSSYVNASSINVNLAVSDGTSCASFATQNIQTATTQPFELSTNVDNYDNLLNAFIYCEDNAYFINDTLLNINSSAGVDTIIVAWNNGESDTICNTCSITDFDSLQVTLDTATVTISITTITSNCDPITFTYDFIFNGGNVPNTADPFGDVTNSGICLGDTAYYVIDPDVFEMAENGIIYFLFECGVVFDSIPWSYDDYTNFMDSVDTDNNPQTPDELNAVLEYVFPSSSCNCYTYTESGIPLAQNQYFVAAFSDNGCETQNIGATQTQILPLPEIQFIIDTAICVNEGVTIINNTTFQCVDTIGNQNFPTYATSNPSFTYFFGDCIDTITYIPTANEYENESYASQYHTYTSAGIYPIYLTASNACEVEEDADDTIYVFPPPNVSFIADPKCFQDTTLFIPNIWASPDTTDILSCGILIDVPAGGEIDSIHWSMI